MWFTVLLFCVDFVSVVIFVLAIPLYSALFSLIMPLIFLNLWKISCNFPVISISRYRISFRIFGSRLWHTLLMIYCCEMLVSFLAESFNFLRILFSVLIFSVLSFGNDELPVIGDSLMISFMKYSYAPLFKYFIGMCLFLFFEFFNVSMMSFKFWIYIVVAVCRVLLGEFSFSGEGLVFEGVEFDGGFVLSASRRCDSFSVYQWGCPYFLFCVLFFYVFI